MATRVTVALVSSQTSLAILLWPLAWARPFVPKNCCPLDIFFSLLTILCKLKWYLCEHSSRSAVSRMPSRNAHVKKKKSHFQSHTCCSHRQQFFKKKKNSNFIPLGVPIVTWNHSFQIPSSNFTCRGRCHLAWLGTLCLLISYPWFRWNNSNIKLRKRHKWVHAEKATPLKKNKKRQFVLMPL